LVLKRALNPNFLNLLLIEKNFGFRYVLVPFLNLLLLKSKAESLLSFKNQVLQMDF